jgi:hypothetical protein
MGVAEGGPTGTPRVLDDETVATKKLSEIYAMLGGSDPAASKALVDAESRLAATSQRSLARSDDGPLPRAAERSTNAGPTFYTAAEQTWFASQFCVSNWQCVQGYTWANSSYGNHAGRGYASYGFVGSEATTNHVMETDYWNGSSWQAVTTYTLPPGWSNYQWAGNTGASNCNDGNWYFKSEIPGDYTNPLISLSDHVYSGDGGHAQHNCGTGSTIPYGADICGCDTSVCIWYGGQPAWVSVTCKGMPVCADDLCCNPP